jgi:hypothetical protein
MIRILLLLVAGNLLLATDPVRAQSRTSDAKDSVTRLFRVYEDDDYINFWGNGTDNAYTNGSRLDYFYQPAHRPHGILGRYGLRAGPRSTDVYSWGLQETMYTPNDLTKAEWQPDDYQYAGAITASHSRYSYDPVGKYSLQTELVMGIIGPSALAGQIQSGFHRLIHYTQPKGWGHQFRNDILLNINLTAEKQLSSAGNWLTLVGGARVYAGTMQNGAALYPLLLIGKMAPYFNGYFSRYLAPSKKKWQGYLLVKPELQYFAQNALLQGGLFTHNPNGQPGATGGKDPGAGTADRLQGGNAAPAHGPELQPWVASVTYGFVVSRGRFGLSVTETVSSTTLRRLYCHDVGNVSLYFGL